MRTLFAKILLWFGGTAVFGIVGMVVIMDVSAPASSKEKEPTLQTLRFQGGAAVSAYEEGGRPALRRALSNVYFGAGQRLVLTDAQGHPLNGRSDDLGPLVERARRSSTFPDLPSHATVFAVPIAGRQGSYWFFLLAPPEGASFWIRLHHAFAFPHVWLIIVVSLVSYALAWQLTRPIQELRVAAERLGRGDFGARVRSDRKDELGDLARTFDSMAERIERAVTAQRQLVQDVSHELRSPLSRIAVAVELARTNPDPNDALDRANREVERLNALIEELLAATRDELHAAPVDLAALLAEVVEAVEIEARARNCRIALDSPGPLEVTADARLLRRALENVARNAVHYTAPGTEVRISTRRRDGGIDIVVEDAGPGVPEESLPRLFDPFYRVAPDRDRSTGGVGLGLSIARRAIELHGGTVAAANTHPGLRVVMSLPASRVIMKSG
jgi:signal transduction histidine kinase